MDTKKTETRQKPATVHGPNPSQSEGDRATIDQALEKQDAGKKG